MKFTLPTLLKFYFCLIITAFTLQSCGTLGGFETVTLTTSKQKLEKGIDSLYLAYPDYRIPSKWKSKDDWSARGYDFLESRLFYFKNKPEELYYVSFVGDSQILADTTQVSISVRAVTNESSGWQLEKDISSGEHDRIELRFRKEIIEKLERITNSNVK
jgi:hypothetical protein